MLSTILPLLAGCASKATGTDLSNWCLEDRFLCMSHQDTIVTQDEITLHNVGFVLACPRAPRTCK